MFKTSAGAIDIQTKSLLLTPKSCRVALACIMTDTRARRRNMLQSLAWAVYGETKKTYNLTTGQNVQH